MCDHKSMKLVRNDLADHAMFYRVCEECRSIEAVAPPTGDILVAPISKAFVDELFKRTVLRRNRGREYREYIRSSAWSVKRRLVLVRDEYTCRVCKATAATQVHHKSYRRLFHEPLSDLISLCELCHEELHHRA